MAAAQHVSGRRGGVARCRSAGGVARPAAAGANRRVAVIGAGIGGLTAALTLHDGGLLPQVFEASGRFGGRIHTNRSGWFGEQTAEWCGELIDSSLVTMRALIKRFGLPLTDVLAVVPHGAHYTPAQRRTTTARRAQRLRMGRALRSGRARITHRTLRRSRLPGRVRPRYARSVGDRSRVARHTKMHVPFAQRLWQGKGAWPGTSDGTVFTDLEFQNAWDTTRGQPGRSGILAGYRGATPATAPPNSTRDMPRSAKRFSTRSSAAAIRFGWSDSSRPSATAKGAPKVRFTSPASIRRSPSRATWKAGRLAESARRTKSSTPCAASRANDAEC
jgi:hypothetical protein